MKSLNFPPELSDKQINSICLSYRHDFSLEKNTEIEKETGFPSSGTTEKEREDLRFLVKEIYHAIRKELFYIENPLEGVSSKELFKELLRRDVDFSALDASTKELDIGRIITTKDLTVEYNETDDYYQILLIEEDGTKIVPHFGLKGITMYEWMDFFPNRFYMLSSSSVGFDGTKEEAFKVLKEAGFSV